MLTDPSIRNAKASGTAAGWPVPEGADYRRMLIGDPSDYRTLGLDLAQPTATRPYYLTEDELEDVSAVHQHAAPQPICESSKQTKHD